MSLYKIQLGFSEQKEDNESCKIEWNEKWKLRNKIWWKAWKTIIRNFIDSNITKLLFGSKANTFPRHKFITNGYTVITFV
jgi:hypothetical protein